MRTHSRAALLALTLAASPAMAKETVADAWKAVDTLVDQQKYQEAADLLDKRIASARKAGPEGEGDWLRALIKDTQLRIALHGYETAVRFLKDQPWPKAPLHRAVCELYYAHALVTYYQVYSWEVNQREKTDSKGAVDLKAWTRDEIFAEANRAFFAAYEIREVLGKEQANSLGIDYLRPNNYPKGIRDTLRDAVTYLWIDLLSNTTGWRPEQSNEVWQLDFPALLQGQPLPATAGGNAKLAVKLDDPAAHPLSKVVALLDELQAWHQGRGEIEGALEAELARLRLLSAHFTSTAQRTAVQKTLSERLTRDKELPWWSAGAAQLAELYEGDTEGTAGADNLVRARAIAKAGEDAHADSVGGERCHALVARIEAPAFGVTGMQNDAQARRSLEVTHKNLPKLFFRAYAVDLVTQLTDWGKHPGSGYWGSPEQFLSEQDRVVKLLKSKQPAASWQTDLAPTPDYKEHRTFVTPPLTENGAYVVVASMREDFQQGLLPVVATELLVSDLVLTTRDDPDGTLVVEALSGSDGTPLGPTQVSLYRFDWQHPPKLAETRIASFGGSVRFSAERRDANYFVVGKNGASWALRSNVYFSPRGGDGVQVGGMIFTDRSIYRPLQKIYWKVLSYQGTQAKADWTLRRKVPLTVQLVDANGQLVDTQRVTSDDFGAAAGEFQIPSGRLLGSWRIELEGQTSSNVQIEEYKRPTFEVKLQDPEAALRLNRPATLVGEARYYFGLPVTSGSVKWKVTREPVYPPWWGWWFGGGGGASASQLIASGVATLGDDGRFRFRFTPAAPEGSAEDASQSANGVTYRYQAAVDVVDEGGESHNAQRGFRLGAVAVEASLNANAGFFAAGKTAEVTATRTDLDGTPRAGAASYRILALAQPSAALLPADLPLPQPPGGIPGVHTPGDALRPRWSQDYAPERVLRGWSDGQEVAHGDLTHDATGVAHLAWPALPAGAYRIRYRTKDDFGATFETQSELLVADSHTPLALAAMLSAEQSTVKVGERARLLVASGFHGQEMALEISKAGKVVERRKIVAGQDGTLVELPIGEKDRGGFAVTLQLLRDHQWIQLSQTVFVPWDNKQLALEFSTFRDKLRPGTDETWRVKIRAPGGGPVPASAAQVLAYMYDKSLDFFAPHNPPSLLSLWPSFASANPASPTLGEHSAQGVIPGDLTLPGFSWPEPDALAFYDSYGIGGMGVRGYGYGGGGYARGMAMDMAAPVASAPAPEMAEKKMAVHRMAEAPAKSANKPAPPGEPPPPPAQPSAGAEAPAPLRTNFSETAFFLPKLLTDADGSVAIEFKVPDSVTGWNVWVHALSRDLKAGSLHKETQTVKDLLVRPYLPRFLREGDKADLKVVVNDASDHDLSGALTLEIFDPETNQSLLSEFGLTPAEAKLPFAVKKGGGTNLTFSVTAPKRVGLVAVKVLGSAGAESDGEQRPLPLLPSRMHLAQSRFVSLKDDEKRKLTFEDLAKSNDPTRQNEQLVVTVDAQLFLGVLNALPYLINYPYECSEQTLNRFVTTGILSSLYKNYPGVAAMAKQMSQRNTQLETWNQADPNRKMALEETPWVQESKGGSAQEDQLAKVLDPRIAGAQRDESLAKLRKAQLDTGAFPWWPGGPPSPYMTLYIVYGFSKATEFGVDVPKEVVTRAFSYLAAVEKEYWQERLAHSIDWEFLTFLNYVCTNFPDDSWIGEAITKEERKQMLEYSFEHWKEHSPYLKGLLALTLKRMGRPKDANLVFDSVMDSSKTVKDEGTFWAPEDRSWLWYNDTIETQAFALRTLTELKPQDPRKDGLVLWLFLNKKLNHWKSTRATAEVLYSLAKVLTAEHALGVREEAKVTIGGSSTDLIFEPDKFAPKRQVVVQGPDVTPADAHIEVAKTGKGFAFASATWQYSTDELPTEDRGDFFKVSRHYFKRELQGKEMVLKPIAEGAQLQVGDELEVQISLRSKHEAEYVHLRDPRGAGFEPVTQVSQFKWDLGIGWYEEVRDSGENFFFEQLPVGEYTFKYRVRANMAGAFRVGPATVQSMYAPEFNAFSSGALLKVTAAK